LGYTGKATEKGDAQQYSEDPRQTLLPEVGSSRERPLDEAPEDLKTRLLLLAAFLAIVIGAVLGCTVLAFRPRCEGN
jgi:hypothetical protein